MKRNPDAGDGGHAWRRADLRGRARTSSDLRPAGRVRILCRGRPPSGLGSSGDRASGRPCAFSRDRGLRRGAPRPSPWRDAPDPAHCVSPRRARMSSVPDGPAPSRTWCRCRRPSARRGSCGFARVRTPGRARGPAWAHPRHGAWRPSPGQPGSACRCRTSRALDLARVRSCRTWDKGPRQFAPRSGGGGVRHRPHAASGRRARTGSCLEREDACRKPGTGPWPSGLRTGDASAPARSRAGLPGRPARTWDDLLALVENGTGIARRGRRRAGRTSPMAPLSRAGDGCRTSRLPESPRIVCRHACGGRCR